MTAVRAICAYMDNSGLDDVWQESGVYWPAMVSQIIDCTHYYRAINAHQYTYLALFELIMDAFLSEEPTLKGHVIDFSSKMDSMCQQVKEKAKANFVKAHQDLQRVLIENEISEKLAAFMKKKASENAMFKAMMNYMEAVDILFYFHQSF